MLCCVDSLRGASVMHACLSYDDLAESLIALVDPGVGMFVL